VSRISDDLEIYTGLVRSFEWYWDENDEMPGLDVFNDLNDDDKAAVMASLEHWGDLELEKRVSETRINEECAEPKILAVKGGKHRFAMFHAGNNVWIVCDYYRKQKEKLVNWVRPRSSERLRRSRFTRDEFRLEDTMNAIEAREARRSKGKRNLSQRLRDNPEMAARTDAYLDDLRLEQQFLDAMQEEHISAAELARRTNRKPAAISRDLGGGLSDAKLGRVREMAAAFGYDVVAVLVPKDPKRREEVVGCTAEGWVIKKPGVMQGVR